VVASPVWNIGLAGLPATYGTKEPDLVPEWSPWPGEQATLTVGRAEAVQGATVTVGSVQRVVDLGLRQRTETLSLTVRSSLGEDFGIRLPEGVEVTSLTVDKKEMPVRSEGGRLVVPMHPGAQTVGIGWRSDQKLGVKVAMAPVTLPVESANLSLKIRVPAGRWVLWAHGPLRGPAVRFWSVLVFSILAGWALGGMPNSNLHRAEWIGLCMGLTQVHLVAGFTVVVWLLALSARARGPYEGARAWVYNTLQISLLFLSLGALCVLGGVVARGLLGQPETFILGNDSTQFLLHWFEARSAQALPQPGCVLVSVWWYRLLMLVWALWLASALLRWLRTGWAAFSTGGCLRQKPRLV
jgi:hypothetical protein